MENTETRSFISEIFRAAVNALLVTIVAVLLFALVLRFAPIPDKVIMPVNQFIKTVAIFLGCYVGIKNGKGLVKGLIAGFVISVLTYLLFSLLSGSIAFNLFTAIDLLAGTLIGGISGAICMLIRKR